MTDKVYSTCGEIFNYDLPEFDVGDHYYSGDKQEIKPSELLWDVAYIIELMTEQLYDRVGEVAENFEPTDEEKEAVFVKLKTAVDEHFNVNCYGVTNIEEHVMK